jgi:hypothetical protein
MKTEAIIILGMHRSGTSCLTGCLKSYGLELGNVSDFNKNNLKGNQENREVFKLNEKVLNHNQGNWHTPPSSPLSWTQEHLQEQQQLLQYYNGLKKPWGIKDPRMVLVFSFWQHQLPKSTGLVGTFRNPIAVAQSLAARKKLSIPIDEGLALWNTYNQALIALYQKHNFPILNFDLEEREYLKSVKLAAKKMGLDNNPDEMFYDSELKNQKAEKLQACPTEYKQTYQNLLEIGRDSVS